MWLKIIVENYCHQLYAKRVFLETEVTNDRFLLDDESLLESTRNINMEDIHKILSMMPNRRYRQLIEYRYIDERTNEETAMLLSVTMANYYNMHKRAKAQYCEVLRKEGLS
jgi:DNA-directed RNA polymerase specialized sigma24 family protein